MTLLHPRQNDASDVWIRDTGIGIAAEHLPHVLGRVWRENREDRRPGAGIGLSIVKGLVEAHEGRIWFESTPGKGTTVFFTLPLAPPREQPHAEPAPSGP